jgi:ribonuclease HI
MSTTIASTSTYNATTVSRKRKRKDPSHYSKRKRPAETLEEPVKEDDLFILQADGGSRGNPGPAAGGAVIWCSTDSKTLLFNDGIFVGDYEPNNVAEYSGFIFGLKHAYRMNIKRLHVRLDSMLIVNQMNGEWNVGSPRLKPLYDEAQKLSKLFDEFKITHVRRHLNALADAACNRILDRHCLSK